MQTKFKKLLVGLAVLVGLSLAAFAPVLQQATVFRSIRVEHDATIGGTLGVTGASTFGSGLTVSDGNAVIADFAQLTAQTAISVTDGGVITPSGSYQPLESGGAVTATLSSGCTAGRQVILVNTVNQTIIISETATSALSGNASLGQYDALALLCDGTRWVQTAPESDN